MADTGYLEELLRKSEAISRGAGSVPNTAPSPSMVAPAGTPESDIDGAIPPGPASSEAAGVPPPPPDLEGMLAASEAQSRQPTSPGPLANYSAGFMGRSLELAHTINMPQRLAEMAVNIPKDGLVKAGVDFLTGSQKGMVSSKQFLSSIGIPTEPEKDSTAGHIGRNTADGLVTLMALYSAAPTLAARSGFTTKDYIARALGEAIQRHPWLGIVSDVVGGIPGSTIGEEHFGPAGALAGGVVGNLATAPLQATARAGVKVSQTLLGKVADAVDNIAARLGSENTPIPGLQKPKPPGTVPDDILDAYRQAETRARQVGEAVVVNAQRYREAAVGSPERFQAAHDLWASKNLERDANAAVDRAWNAIPVNQRQGLNQQAEAIRAQFAETSYPTHFAEEQIAGDIKVVQDKIDAALNSVQPNTPGMTAEQYSAKMANGVAAAEKLATKMEAKYWKRVPLKDQMPDRNTPLQDLDSLRAEMRQNFSSIDIPEDAFKRMYKLFAPQSSPGVFQPLPTLQKLRAEITAIRQDRKVAMAADAPNDRYIANLAKLESQANQWIGDAFPNNIPLQQARAFSNTYHDLFSRSEIFPLLRTGARGQDKIRPEDMMSKLLTTPHALDDIYAMTQRLMREPRLTGQPDAYPTLLSPRQAAPLKQLQDDISNGIRAAFQDTVAQSERDPLAVQKVVDRWIPRIQSFSKAAGELQGAVSEAVSGIEARRAIEKSALAKYVLDKDPQTAINRVWSSPNAAATAKALISGEAGVGGFAKDPIALEGFRAGILDKLFEQGKMDPVRIQQLMRDGRTDRLLQASLGSDRYERLKTVVNASVKLDNQTTSTWAQNVIWLSRIAAVKVSALLPHIGKGGELQQAAIFSEIARRKVMDMLQGGNPTTLLNEAIRNPAMERMLFSKLPENVDDIKRSMLLLRRTLRFDAGVRGMMENYLGSDEKDSPKPVDRRSAISTSQINVSANIPVNTPANPSPNPFSNAVADITPTSNYTGGPQTISPRREDQFLRQDRIDYRHKPNKPWRPGFDRPTQPPAIFPGQYTPNNQGGGQVGPGGIRWNRMI